MASRASVEKGKVVSATPAFAWAVGEGIHVLLSYCAEKGIKWKRRPKPQKQMELSL